MSPHKELPNFPNELLELLESPDALPPVEKWSPTRVGEIDISIKRDGSWWFEGEPMTREATVRLFSRILLKERGAYYLVTPVEKLKIDVELKPFVVRLVNVEGAGEAQRVMMSTNVGDTFEVSDDHPLRLEAIGGAGDLLPLVTVRRNLEALVSRPVYYELAEHLTESVESPGQYGIWSGGNFFQL